MGQRKLWTRAVSFLWSYLAVLFSPARSRANGLTHGKNAAMLYLFVLFAGNLVLRRSGCGCGKMTSLCAEEYSGGERTAAQKSKEPRRRKAVRRGSLSLRCMSVDQSRPSSSSQGFMALELLAVSPGRTVECGQRAFMAGRLSAMSLPPLVQKGMTVLPERSWDSRSV